METGTRTPWKTGLSLSLLMVVSYTVCAVLYGLRPEEGINFLNALFHGLDFRRLVVPAPFSLSGFLYPLLVLAVWGFFAGSLFAWLDNLLQGLGRATRSKRLKPD